MCTTCGCGVGETRIEGSEIGEHEHDHEHWHVHADGTAHAHPSGQASAGEHAHAHVHSDGTVHTHTHAHHDEHEHPHGAAVEAHGHAHTHADGTTHSHAHQHHGEHQHAHGSAQVQHSHAHTHADGTTHAHGHDHVAEHLHEHPHEHGHSDGHVHDHRGGRLDFGAGPARSHAPGMTQARMVQIERDILSKNDAYAVKNRQALTDRGILALNFVSSPGSGKTTLLCRTIEAIKSKYAVAVIEGDQQTANDAERIRATGAPAIQINTGKGCHLDAQMVGHALDKLRSEQKLADDGLLFIENVGNLVCPAAFDLGEAAKVAILSVTEGEDKPLKYPDMFRAARLMLLNKVDLLPYLSFDVDAAIAAARRVNPQIEVIRVSATSGEGLADWLAWLDARFAEAQQGKLATVEALRRKVAQLEAELQARSPSSPGGR
jgi:hydrogenase nickel incorporation protein HypB